MQIFSQKKIKNKPFYFVTIKSKKNTLCCVKNSWQMYHYSDILNVIVWSIK